MTQIVNEVTLVLLIWSEPANLSLAVHLVQAPLSFILVAVRQRSLAVSVPQIVIPVPHVLVTLHVSEIALSVLLVHLVTATVPRAGLSDPFTFSVECVVVPATGVSCAMLVLPLAVPEADRQGVSEADRQGVSE